MLKSLIEVRRNARGEKFKQFFFSSNHQNCIMVPNVPCGDAGNWGWESRANKRAKNLTSGSPGVVRLFLNAGYFLSMGRQITSPIWSPAPLCKQAHKKKTVWIL